MSAVGLLKTLWEKKKLLIMSNFSFSHRVFYPFREFSTIFINFRIVICTSFSLEVSKICRLGNGEWLKYVIWERENGQALVSTYDALVSLDSVFYFNFFVGEL